jgi:hypothetical protein
MADAIPEILIVGQPQTGAASLVHRLFHTQGVAPVEDGATRPATIDTKYYTASVQLRYLDPNLDLAATSAAAQREFGDGGLVLAFSVSEESSFDSVKSWVAGQNTATAGVCLCVATHADSLASDRQQEGPVEAQRPAWVDAVIEWCSEQGFEYIECCLDDPELDSRLRLDGDVQGLQRITEALTAHMWPGLIRKSGPAAAAVGQSSSQSISDTSSAQPQQAQQQQAPGPDTKQGSTANGDPDTDDEERRLEEHIEKMDALMADMAGRLNTTESPWIPVHTATPQ